MVMECLDVDAVGAGPLAGEHILDLGPVNIGMMASEMSMDDPERLPCAGISQHR